MVTEIHADNSSIALRDVPTYIDAVVRSSTGAKRYMVRYRTPQRTQTGVRFRACPKCAQSGTEAGQV